MVHVARFVSGFAAIANPVERPGIHAHKGEHPVNPCGSVPPGEYHGVSVQRAARIVWSFIVITADVSGNPAGEEAFKSLFGACWHRF